MRPVKDPKMRGKNTIRFTLLWVQLHFLRFSRPVVCFDVWPNRGPAAYFLAIGKCGLHVFGSSRTPRWPCFPFFHRPEFFFY